MKETVDYFALTRATKEEINKKYPDKDMGRWDDKFETFGKQSLDTVIYFLRG